MFIIALVWSFILILALTEKYHKAIQGVSDKTDAGDLESKGRSS